MYGVPITHEHGITIERSCSLADRIPAVTWLKPNVEKLGGWALGGYVTPAGKELPESNKPKHSQPEALFQFFVHPSG
jgi:hypothetical protein